MSAIDDVLRRAGESDVERWRLSSTSRAILATTNYPTVGDVTRVVFLAPNQSEHAAQLMSEDAKLCSLLPRVAKGLALAVEELQALAEHTGERHIYDTLAAIEAALKEGE